MRRSKRRQLAHEAIIFGMLKERPNPKMRLSEEHYNRIKTIAEEETQRLVVFGQEVGIEFQSYQLVFIYDYFFNLIRSGG